MGESLALSSGGASRHAQRRGLHKSRLHDQEPSRGVLVSWLDQGGTSQRFAGARNVGCAFRGRQVSGWHGSIPFHIGRVLARRRGDRRVRVEHGVRRVLRVDNTKTL